MEGVLRFLFALLLGVVLGVAGTGYLLQSGAGDFLIRRTDAVQDVERRLRDVETQRDQLGRQLEDVISRAGRMEAAFTELERRFRELGHELDAKRVPGGE
jgi:ribosomal protein L9